MSETPPPAHDRLGIWMVAWSNPHKPRPEGFPEVILRVETPLAKGQGAGVCPPDVQSCWEEMRPYGYAVMWHHEGPPPRQLPLASKQRIRRRNLWKRLLKRYPMFVETFYRDQVEARPEQYGPFTAGEFANVQFARTTMGNLKIVQPTATPSPARAEPPAP